ncbi:hypothetical protein BCR36DRAFT_328382 [Piromyces finnis]|uniref:Uncharacterized protein n=1 Tax=Piromyces finnis TaxID=1754191 RepID=A0A1Y1V7R8_9FUNG|nr:hypothetical protein BCR36DRAFT_328382 [Piromyces finnis]|eukprot:ORX49307.1 hypothetical protein BCR36DRAFT_328382 [Piromyces finnis]
MGKNLIPEGKWSRITLLWSFSQFIIISVIECLIIFQNHKYKDEIEKIKDKNETGNLSALIVYQYLFIVALAYQLYLTVDTLLKFSTIDLIALAIFNSMCLVYSLTQHIQHLQLDEFLKIKELNSDYKKTSDKIKNIEYIVITIMIMYIVGWWYITFRLYKVFGWNVFKQIGADINLKNRLKLFNILVTLLKLSFFFIDILFMVQYFAIAIAIKDKNKDFITMEKLVVAAITVIGTILGFLAVAKVNRLSLAIYILMLCVDMGFISSVFTDIYCKVDDNNPYKAYKISLTVTILCTIPLCLVTYGVSLINFKNFGLGIPKSVNRSSLQSGQSVRSQQKRFSLE